MSPDLGAFLEVAVAVNLLSQWKAVFGFVAKLYLGATRPRDEVLPVLRKRDQWLRRIWIAARTIAVPSAAAAYLALLFGVPAPWLPWFALAVGLPVPLIMLILLPVVANAFGLRTWYLTRRAAKKAEAAASLEREFEERFQKKLEEMASRGEVVIRRDHPPF